VKPASSHPVALASLGYFVTTFVYTWPLPRHLFDGVPHDYGDPILTTWMLWWTTKAMPLTQAWWNAPMFYPAVGTFAFSEHLLGLAPIAAPIIALTGQPLLGHNVTLLASYVLCGLGAYFLTYTITSRHDAAFVAGMAYAFAPYRLSQLPHIHVLSSYWAPICLAALHRYDRDATLKWAALAAGAWLMQGLANGYFLFFLMVLLAGWFLWFAAGRWSIAKLARAGICFAVAGIVALPVLLGYQRILHGIYGFARGLHEVQYFSADAAALLNASDELLLWGWVHAFRRPEGELFPGIALTALAMFAVLATRPWAASPETTRRRWWLRRLFGGLFVILMLAALLPIYYGSWRLTIGGVRLVSIGRADKPLTLALLACLAWLMTLPRVVQATRERSALTFYALGAAAMFVFALGPDPAVMGHRLIYQAPYGWLMRLPAFDGLRVPARFWVMALACLSVLAGMAVHTLHGRTRRIVTVIAVAALALDGWPRHFRVLPAPEHRPTPPGVVARLDLPMDDDHDALALYQQTFDAVPLYNGYSGYAAPHQFAMRQLLTAHDASMLRAMTGAGPLGVIVDHAADADSAHRRFVLAYPGATLVETHDAWSSYRLPAGDGGVVPPDEAGTPLAIASLHAFPSAPNAPLALDGNRRTRWSGGVQRNAADFTIEVAQPGFVRQVVTDLGEYWTDFPVRLRVEVSADGSTWQTVSDGGTALQAYYGSLRHPKSLPIVCPIGRDGVRFIRLTQLGWGDHDWSIAEVRVLR
jgi:hypothetical protein